MQLNVKGLKDAAVRQGFKLMSDPRVMKLMQNPKVSNAVMKAFQLRGKVNAKLDEQKTLLAKRLNLATRREVDDLKRSLTALQKQTARA